MNLGIVALVVVALLVVVILWRLQPPGRAVIVIGLIIFFVDGLLWNYVLNQTDLFESYDEQEGRDELTANIAIFLMAALVGIVAWKPFQWLMPRSGDR